MKTYGMRALDFNHGKCLLSKGWKDAPIFAEEVHLS